LTTVTTWSTNAVELSNGCAGTCTSSTRSCGSRSGLSIAPSGSTAWHAGSTRPEQTTQVRIARELLARCRNLTRSILELDRELQARTTALAPRLLELPGCASLTAAKLLCEIGPIDRFRSDAQLARHAGVAPLDASSGKHQRHRLDRGGNRQLNCALHRIAVTQGRVHAPAKAYLERKQAEGKSRREALRCLKRQLARTIYTTLKSEPLLT
jgi:transposase